MQAKWLRILRTIVTILALAFVIGIVLQHSAEAVNREKQRAGFARGLLHGVLMPMAFPNLLVGKDVPIYASNNTGVPYKLGYTAGVNACGAVFFGCFFWRWSRMRRPKPPL
ncbi:MAG TPA: hypothetical protein VK850_04180 [Candidatus Binatia bacterium]|nr:hypothetical protein [Candidatus Binatia bacterium]